MSEQKFQVLYKAHPPQTGVEVENYTTRREAENAVRRLRRRGETEVTIWDTFNNPLSKYLTIGIGGRRR